jgi:hypothetical protein
MTGCEAAHRGGFTESYSEQTSATRERMMVPGEEAIMPKTSQEFRDRAAKEVRAARRSSNSDDKAECTERAAPLKELAHNEEWLGGERERSAKRKPESRR